MYDIQLEFRGDVNKPQPDFGHISEVEVPVEVINDDLETIVEETRSLLNPQPVSVPTEGQYQVRVRLPSGERVSTMVTVPAETGGMPVAVLRAKDYSLHESLAWAYTAQGIKRAAHLPTRSGQQSGRKLSSWDAMTFAMKGAGADPDTAMESLSPSVPVALGVMYQITGWNEAQHFWTFSPLPAVTIPPESEELDDLRVRLRWRGARPEWEGSDPYSWRPSYQRYTRAERAPDVALFAVPPSRWTDILLIETGETSATGLRPMARGSNPQADALLSYLGQGAFEAARQVGERFADQLEMMLAGKADDPISAIVAGYFMLKASSLRHENWLQRLAEGFSGLPDGAVIFGWALLRREEPDYTGARRFFLMAAHRGIPIYSTGLRLLYDGLNVALDHDEADREVYQTFQAVRRIVATIDWKADVTSFSLSEAEFKAE